MQTERDFQIIEAMEKYGGSFVKALAVCFRRADSINFRKLKIVFSNYWAEYEDMVKGKPRL